MPSVTQAVTPASAASVAPASALNEQASISAGPRTASTAPATAVAISPPVRAIALLKPDAVPVWRSSTGQHRRGQRRDRARHAGAITTSGGRTLVQ